MDSAYITNENHLACPNNNNNNNNITNIVSNRKSSSSSSAKRGSLKASDKNCSPNSSNENNSSASNSDNSSTDEGIENPPILDEFDDDEDEDEDEEEEDEDDELNGNKEYKDDVRFVGIVDDSLNDQHSDSDTILEQENGPHLHHQHHEHHSNHHNQHNHLDPNYLDNEASSLVSLLNCVPNTAGSFADLSTLQEEESRLLKDILELEREASVSLSTPDTGNSQPNNKSGQNSNNNNCGLDNNDEDDDDEELLEFQRIEREIKLSELRKCLLMVQKQIENHRRKLSLTSEITVVVPAATIANLQKDRNMSANSNSQILSIMTDSMIERSRVSASEQVNLDEDSQLLDTEKTAPLAEQDSDTESLNVLINQPEDSVQKLSTSTPFTTAVVAPSFLLNKPQLDLNGHTILLSDTDSDDGVDDKESLNESFSNSDSNDKASSGNHSSDNLCDKSLDDLLHQSIEESLEKVNKISDIDQDNFVHSVSNGHSQPMTNKQDKSHRTNDNAANLSNSPNSILRRESRYENEKNHNCNGGHSGRLPTAKFYVDSVQIPKSTPYYTSLLNQSFDELLNQSNTTAITEGGGPPATSQTPVSSATDNTEDTDDSSLILRRRSGKFPTDGSDDRLDNEASNIRRRTSASNSSINATSQRPLTLYLPSPNQELNLITHLHALGHDLTSTIVTNHLLITPFTCSGYLYKQCASSTTKWRKRYFHFNRVRKVFVYFHDRSSFEKRRHPKRGVFFDEIQDVYVDHTRINMKKFCATSGSSANVPPTNSNAGSGSINHHLHQYHHQVGSPVKRRYDGTRCIFVVSTTTMNRKFILSTYVPELMRIWMDVIFTGANAYLHDFDAD